MATGGSTSTAAKRKRHSPEFKAKVALEALKGLKTSHELAREYEVHSTQIAQWKRQLREHAGDAFRRPASVEASAITRGSSHWRTSRSGA